MSEAASTITCPLLGCDNVAPDPNAHAEHLRDEHDTGFCDRCRHYIYAAPGYAAHRMECASD